MSWEELYKEKKKIINSKIEEYLNEFEEKSLLKEAIHYSLMAGGKRLRPFLSILITNLLNKDENEIYPFAIAIEFIHTYSLIHDDLPSMDNDDFRRGMPTCHKKFGEALAILAGDALLTDAFTLFLTKSNGNITKAGSYLAKAAGGRGMILGQALDLNIKEEKRGVDTLDKINYYKTGCMIEASIVGPALLFNAGEEIVSSLEIYAKNIGLAFQITDDILDVIADEKELGKPTGSDAKLNKKTYPALLGIEESYKRAKLFIKEAKESLKIIKPSEYKEILLDFTDYIVNRKN